MCAIKPVNLLAVIDFKHLKSSSVNRVKPVTRSLKVLNFFSFLMHQHYYRGLIKMGILLKSYSLQVGIHMDFI